MRVSMKSTYGLEALFDLAYHCAGRAAQAREIAERQKIPLRYLEQILQDLRRAGLVEARRGPRGGYALARAPASVRLSEIVAALESPPRAETELEGERERGGAGQVAAGLWRELAVQIEALYAGVRLQDLVDRALALGVARAEPAPQMYFI